ncbi:hypothetical protein KCU65_g1586, partial [Aureobasidium melanogenum]
MDNFLRRLIPMANVITHIRALGFNMVSWFFEWCPVADCSTSQDGYTDEDHEIRTVLRRIRKLRDCHDVYGIPLHRLHVDIRYSLPLAPKSTRRAAFFRKIIPIDCGLVGRVRIHVSSKSRSIAALDQECNRLLLDIHSRLDEHLDMVQSAERDGSKDANWIAIQKDLSNHFKRSLPTVLSAIRNYHETVINQVIQFCKDEEAFEKFCLGDFFALAEAW